MTNTSVAVEKNRFEQVRFKCTQVIEKARDLYGVNLSNVNIDFRLKGSVSGWAGCERCRVNGMIENLYKLRFNKNLINSKHFQDILDNTVPHEIAHLCGYADRRLGYAHNDAWQRTCISLGGNGKKNHSYEITYVGGNYEYITTTGHTIVLSHKRHTLIQSGMSYTFKNGMGKVNRFSTWRKQGAPMMSVMTEDEYNKTSSTENKAPTHQPIQKSFMMQGISVVLHTDGQSKAEVVREMIRLAKTWGYGQDYVVNEVVKNLGMSKSMAKTYVSGKNWDRY